MNSDKAHWENIYGTKHAGELSWTEEVPKISLDFVDKLHLPKTAAIIDIGGGESKFAGFLLDKGFLNITVLDISEKSIDIAKSELGERADKINWVVQDILEFQTNMQFDLWHDRAAFHFLITPDQIEKYTSQARNHVKPNGYAVIGTFSEDGPKKCSGLPIKQYSPETLARTLQDGFKKLNCISHIHETPFKTKQNFLFCSFQRS